MTRFPKSLCSQKRIQQIIGRTQILGGSGEPLDKLALPADMPSSFRDMLLDLGEMRPRAILYHGDKLVTGSGCVFGHRRRARRRPTWPIRGCCAYPETPESRSVRLHRRTSIEPIRFQPFHRFIPCDRQAPKPSTLMCVLSVTATSEDGGFRPADLSHR
jgi:hypothetical protein